MENKELFVSLSRIKKASEEMEKLVGVKIRYKSNYFMSVTIEGFTPSGAVILATEDSYGFQGTLQLSIEQLLTELHSHLTSEYKESLKNYHEET